jgi:hypothetical protein
MMKRFGRFLLLATLISSAGFTMSRIANANPALCLRTGNNECVDNGCSEKVGGLCGGDVVHPNPGGPEPPSSCACIF